MQARGLFDWFFTRGISNGAISSTGCVQVVGSKALAVRLPGPTLNYADLDVTLCKLRRLDDRNGISQVYLDFADVERIGPCWSAIVAHLLLFLVRTNVAAVALNLRQQPLAVMQHLCGDRVTSQLVKVPALVPQRRSWRRAG